jgi:hypothetical protein
MAFIEDLALPSSGLGPMLNWALARWTFGLFLSIEMIHVG